MSIPITVTVNKYHLTDAADEPLEGATVSLMDAWAISTDTTDVNGEATVNIPAPFNYKLSAAVTSGNTVLTVDFSSYATVYNLEMKADSYIEITQDDESTHKTTLASAPNFTASTITITDALTYDCALGNGLSIYPDSEWMVSVTLDDYAKGHKVFEIVGGMIPGSATWGGSFEVRLYLLSDTPKGNTKYGDTVTGHIAASWNGEEWSEPVTTYTGIEGAYVTIWGTNGRCSVTTTDANGYFEFSDLYGGYDGGRYWITVYKFDYYTLGVKVFSDNGMGPHFVLLKNTLNIWTHMYRLKHWNGFYTEILGDGNYTEAGSRGGGSITNHAVSGHTDAPSYVYIIGREDNGDPIWQSKLTYSPNFTYTFNVPNGKYIIYCERPYYDIYPEIIEITVADANIENKNFYLTKGATPSHLCWVTGSVYFLDETTGEYSNISRSDVVKVTLINTETGMIEWVSPTGGSEGMPVGFYFDEGQSRYTFNYLPSSTYDLYCSATGYRVKPIVSSFTLTDGEVKYIDLYLLTHDTIVDSLKVEFIDPENNPLPSGIKFQIETRDIVITDGVMTGDPNTGNIVYDEFTDTWSAESLNKTFENVSSGLYFFTFPNKDYEIIDSSEASEMFPVDAINITDESKEVTFYVQKLYNVTIPIITPVEVHVTVPAIPEPASVDDEGIVVIQLPDETYNLTIETVGGSMPAPIGGQKISTKFITGYVK